MISRWWWGFVLNQGMGKTIQGISIILSNKCVLLSRIPTTRKCDYPNIITVCMLIGTTGVSPSITRAGRLVKHLMAVSPTPRSVAVP